MSRLDGFQRRHPAAGYPLAVVYKFVDDAGGHLAALMTYYGFLSIFPLLLLASTLLGIVLNGDQHAQQQVLSSALSQFPVIGDQLKEPEHLGGGATGLIVGTLGALYGGLGVSLAIQNALNTIWTVPKNERPNPIKARARGLLLLTTAGLAILGTTVLSAVSGGAGAMGDGLRVLALAASIVLNAAGFMFGFKVATARHLSYRDVAPGALAAAAIWQLLQTFGASYVGHVVKNASATNSVFALVLGIIAFLYIASLAFVLCAEATAVRVTHIYPRALLTPFTDNVDLTPGDERAYTDQALAQRSKGFETIEVSFDREDKVADESSTTSG